MKKGDVIEGVVEEVKFPNRGVLHTEEHAVEVKNVLPGQRVRAKVTRKRNGRCEAALLEVLEKAPGELEPPCPAFGKCGGCSYLNLSYDRQLTLKQIQVMKLLQQGLDEGRRLIGTDKAAAENEERNRQAEDDGNRQKAEAAGSVEAIQAERKSSDPVPENAAAAGKGMCQEGAPWMHVQTWYEGIHSSPRIFGYRNKMEFTFGDEVKGGPMTLGMHRRGSFHDIVDAGNCVIVDGDFRMIVNAVRDFFTERSIPFYHRYTQEGYLRHLLVRKAARTGEILIDLVTTTQAGPEESALLSDFAAMLEKLPLEGKIAGILHTRNDSLADVVEDHGTDILTGKAYFEEELLHLKFVITPFSFFQTNSYGAETLYTIVRQYIQKVVKPVYGRSLFSEAPDQEVQEQGKAGLYTWKNGSGKPVIFDLYCGTGTISQLVAPVARKVIGVELVEEAVEAARQNAVRNHVSNCEFIAGDVLKVLDEIEEKPDLIILDPPRDGIHPKALPKILAYGVEYILYISCKPTSLARDLPAFLAAGYRPVEGCSVDQFVWTANVETVVLMER